MKYAIKKLWVACVCVSLSSMALANGFYVGAGVGAIGMKNKLSSTSTTTNSEQGTTNVYENNDFNTDVAVNSALFMGYALFFPNKYVLSLEAFANASPVSVNNVVNNSYSTIDSSIKFNSVYGVRLLPGFQVTKSSIVYAIAGYALANAKVQGTLNGTALDSPRLDSQYDETRHLNGYQLGLGAMTHVANHVLIRGDLIYSGYQSTSVTATSNNGDLSNTYSVKPYTIEANLSLMYQFGQPS